MTFRLALAFSAAALSVSAGSAHAIFVLGNGQSISLSQVLSSSDHQFQVGDKLFTIEAYTSPTFNPSSISVTGLISSNPLSGIGFDLTGGFGDQPGDQTISDLTIRYTVEVDPVAYSQGFRITDTGLSFNGNATGAGSFSRVDESILDFFGQPGSNLLGTRRAFFLAGPPPTSQLQDFELLPGASGYRKLEVIKDVQFFANGQGSATASFVRQSFSQIPTPGGTALGLIGGLVLARRRR